MLYIIGANMNVEITLKRAHNETTNQSEHWRDSTWSARFLVLVILIIAFF